MAALRDWSKPGRRADLVAAAWQAGETNVSALAEAAGPVLLVDDFTETGWTLAVAARLLRRAGAQGVLPLVLAVQG